MRTRLWRRAGYFYAGPQRLPDIVLHETQDCPGLRAAVRHWLMHLPEARQKERRGVARLCKRCGSMR